jgi:hypothetical protein
MNTINKPTKKKNCPRINKRNTAILRTFYVFGGIFSHRPAENSKMPHQNAKFFVFFVFLRPTTHETFVFQNATKYFWVNKKFKILFC